MTTNPPRPAGAHPATAHHRPDPMPSRITEQIIKAADSSAMAWECLRAACQDASPLEQLQLERLMESAATTAGAIARFRDALDA